MSDLPLTEQVRRLCKPRYKGDPPEITPPADRPIDQDYYAGVTLKAQHLLERLVLLEIGCTYADLRTMDADEAQELLATHTGRKVAESQRMDEARRDAERANGKSGGSRLPSRAYTDPSYWDTTTWGDISQWGKEPGQDGTPRQAIWQANLTTDLPPALAAADSGIPPEWGLPPE